MSFSHPFVTVTLTYEARSRFIEGQPSKRNQDCKQWGWVIKINGLDPMTSFYSLGGVNEDLFRRFNLKQNGGEREITCFEEVTLSSRYHNQYNPPMTIVTQVLASVTALRYVNTSSAIAACTAEGMESSKCHIPSFMWSFQSCKGPP